MKQLTSRRFASGLFAFALAAAGLLALPAQAEDLMFRMSLRFYGATGTSTTGIHPKAASPACGASGADCAPANVGATLPVAKFTLPKAFRETYYTYSYTGYTGYSSFTTASSYNAEARFRPNNPYAIVPTLPTGPSPTYGRMLFPTTGGNKAPNKGQGQPLAGYETTTFNGDFDFSRAGSVKITPGPNKFGGTMRFLYGPNAAFYQFISYNSPYISKAFGSFACRAGKGLPDCTSHYETKVGPMNSGQFGSSGMVTRYQLTAGGSNKATTGGGAYISSKAYYLSEFHPWTTGMVYAQNPLNKKNQKFTATGYDKVFSPPTSKQIKYTTYTVSGASTPTTKTLTGITRITSMVRPRLRHTYLRPSNPALPITAQGYQAARLWQATMFFMPEPGGMMLLGSGVAFIAGLVLLRRR